MPVSQDRMVTGHTKATGVPSEGKVWLMSPRFCKGSGHQEPLETGQFQGKARCEF